MRAVFDFLRRHWPWLLAGLLLLWLLISYLLMPEWWTRREQTHPALAYSPQLTRTAQGIPGDPVNLALIGTETEVVAAILAAGWRPADPVTWRSSLRIAESAVLHRAYETAPVSDLFLFGRREDLAFEKESGGDARERHHARFWKAPKEEKTGAPCWFGAVTFDRSVGFSHETGQITHHIAPDVDRERDALIADLQKAGKAGDPVWLENFQNPREGRNGGGDPWRTDGRLAVVRLKTRN